MHLGRSLQAFAAPATPAVAVSARVNGKRSIILLLWLDAEGKPWTIILRLESPFE